ncbi:MAG: DUF962 domain-containing protein [Gammaproteobacteria bacterium]|nr:DUF962 domain-containing protein [Gammaproteobacteria bacterium]
MTEHQEFRSFREFYPYYLSEHRNPVCRRLHFAGSLLVIVLIVLAVVLKKPALLIAVPIAGYGFAWIGHFVFEKNRPATFRHPLYSLLGDWAMFRDILTGRIGL